MPWSRLAWGIPGCALLLIAAGLVAIDRAEELADDRPVLAGRQAAWAVVALALGAAACVPSYRRLRPWAYALLSGVMGLLILVFFLPAVAGVHRWIRLGPIGVQPSELAKLAYMIALARYLTYRQNYRRLRGLVVPLGLTMVPLLLVLKEPDLGTAMVFPPLLLAMLFAAGARVRDLAIVCVAGALLAPVVWSQMSREQRSRVTALFEQVAPSEDPGDDGYQLHQAKQMLALGSVWGSWLTGPAVDDPGAYHVPAAPTDFIMSVCGERLGLVGLAVLFSIYAALVGQILWVAAATQDPFGRLLAVGVAALIGIQVLINTGMAVGLLPVTGLSLPLVSYGGTGVLAQSLALGLVINIGLRPELDIAGEPFRFARAMPV